MRGTLSGNLEPETGRELKEPLFIQIKYVFHEQLIMMHLSCESNSFVEVRATQHHELCHSNVTQLYQAQFG